MTKVVAAAIAVTGIVAVFVLSGPYDQRPDKVFPTAALTGCYAPEAAKSPTASIAGRLLTIDGFHFSITPLMQINDRYFFYTSPNYVVTQRGIAAAARGSDNSNHVAFVIPGEHSRLQIQFIPPTGNRFTMSRRPCWKLQIWP